jgi:CHAT domain-containing protein/tetratricopeptide (TPR) repeat protein
MSPPGGVRCVTDDEATRLNREGWALMRAEDLDGAEARFRAALATASPGSVAAAAAHDNLGSALVQAGDIHGGIEEHLAALRLLDRHPDALLDQAITANNVGLAYFKLGNRPLAKEYYERAKRYHDQFGHVTDHYLGTLLNLAVLDGWDDPAAGLREVESMLDGCVYFQDQTGRRSQHASQAVSVRAQFLVRTGNLDAAEPLLDQAIAYFSRQGGPASPDALAARAARADLLRQRGDPAAETELVSVLADQVMADDLAGAEATRSWLAELYFLQGRGEEQAQMLVANVGSEERRTAALVLEASQDEALDAATFEVRHLGRLLSVVDTQHIANPALVGVALEHWLRRKAMTRAVLRRFARVETAGRDPGREAALHAVRAQLDEDIRIATERFVRPGEEWAQRRQRIAANQSRAAELERELGRRSPLDGMAILQSDFVAALRDTLGEKTVLLEICALAAHRTSAAGDAEETWTHGYAAFAVTADSDKQPGYQWLGSSDAIDSLIAETLRQIGAGRRTRDISGAPESTDGTGFDKAVTDGLDALASALLKLVPPGTERLLISADGMLGLLPVQILPHQGGNWLDAFEISYLISSIDLLEDTARSVTAGPPLVIAAPRYSDSGRTTPFASLEGAQQEGHDVAALLGVRALTGAEATKAAALAADHPAVLHLATHAFFEEAGGIAITFWTNQPVRTDADKQPITVADLDFADRNDLRRQLVRAGLAFAGANDADWQQRHAAGSPRTDLDYGLLLAIDVARLDLSDTELVVLSACDTATGRAIVAQGLWGLPLALQAAGARRIVSSLWRVDDDSTRELMTHFYREIVRGTRPAAALRTAAAAVRRTWPQPRYWAGFVLIGATSPVPIAERADG